MLEFNQPIPTHLCANPDCREREWQLDVLGRERWRLRSDGRAFSLAASEPCCPVCGAPLLEIAALEPDLESDIFQEAHPREPPSAPPTSERRAQP